MIAKKMFENLGYKYDYYPNSHYIDYFKNTDEEHSMTFNRVIFYKRFRKVRITGCFDVIEIKAINKQIEELGWNYEK